MKQLVQTILHSVPPFVLFLGALISVVAFGAVKLLALLETVKVAA